MFRILFLTALVLATLPLRAEEAVESIVTKMVARDEELIRHRALYTCTVGATREKLDADGNTLSSSHVEAQMQGENAPENGAPKDQKIESDLKQASRNKPFNILNITSHYHYALVGSEEVEGTPCFKVEFTPKENQPFRNREEKVANELRGYLWIAKADYSLVQHMGRLTKPVPVAWFFASVRDLEFSFQTRRLPNGEVGPSRIQYRFLVQIMFVTIHERHTRTMKDYTALPNQP